MSIFRKDMPDILSPETFIPTAPKLPDPGEIEYVSGAKFTEAIQPKQPSEPEPYIRVETYYSDLRRDFIEGLNVGVVIEGQEITTKDPTITFIPTPPKPAPDILNGGDLPRLDIADPGRPYTPPRIIPPIPGPTRTTTPTVKRKESWLSHNAIWLILGIPGIAVFQRLRRKK